MLITLPTWGSLMPSPSATFGIRPMMANSPVPMAKPPMASASSSSSTARAERGGVAAVAGAVMVTSSRRKGAALFTLVRVGKALPPKKQMLWGFGSASARGSSPVPDGNSRGLPQPTGPSRWMVDWRRFPGSRS
ncbi:hypothetical protein PXNS11_110183 [Stutzerimonas xanthomarina]|nr:hypothetical protein PXNS11_110183 [Stutzerimonas xanthomarina]